MTQHTALVSSLLHREKKKTKKEEAAEKEYKAALKEGGKKGQDLAGMHDLGGMIFFTVCLEQCKGDWNLMQAAIDVSPSSTYCGLAAPPRCVCVQVRCGEGGVVLDDQHCLTAFKNIRVFTTFATNLRPPPCSLSLGPPASHIQHIRHP